MVQARTRVLDGALGNSCRRRWPGLQPFLKIGWQEAKHRLFALPARATTARPHALFAIIPV